MIQTGHIEGHYLPLNVNINDTEALILIKQQITTIKHYCGTCRMGKIDDENAVVDSKLRVFGVKGLRVADASIMPEVTSGNTNNPTMMIGAQCARFLIQKHF